jgi:hypothetical protein
MSNVVTFPIIPRPIPSSHPRSWSPPMLGRLVAMVGEAVGSPTLAEALVTRQYRERLRHWFLDMRHECGPEKAIAALEDTLAFAKQERAAL